MQLPDCSKLTVNWKNGNDVTIFWHDVIVKFFRRCLVSPVTSSYWFRFHVNIITDSGVMIISLRDWNTRVWVLPNIWSLGQVKNTKFGTNAFSKMLLNATKCQVYSFTVSELLRENHQGVKLPRPNQIKSYELEIMNQNAIYICISLYSKIWWFPMKKRWCQQKSRCTSPDSYIFWTFFR